MNEVHGDRYAIYLAATYFSRGFPLQYRRRKRVSRPCSGWERVGHRRYDRQKSKPAVCRQPKPAVNECRQQLQPATLTASSNRRESEPRASLRHVRQALHLPPLSKGRSVRGGQLPRSGRPCASLRHVRQVLHLPPLSKGRSVRGGRLTKPGRREQGSARKNCLKSSAT